MFSLWDILILFLTILFSYYVYFKTVSSKYWSRRNVPHTPPQFLIGGLWKANVTDNMGFMMAKLRLQHKKGKLLGTWFFGKPILIPTDLDIMKKILVSDFHHFRDRPQNGINEEREPLLGHIGNLAGTRWRNMRVKLTPTFTSGKMKMMFPTMVEEGIKLQKCLEKSATSKEEIQAKDIMARFTTDVISSCAFGIESNSLENPESDFRKYGKQIFAPTPSFIFVTTLSVMFPSIAKILPLRWLSKDLSEFFMNTVRETVEYRESNNVKRNDFMQLMIQLKNKGKLDDVDAKSEGAQTVSGSENEKDHKFTIETATAQAFMFFLAGFEAASTTSMFALYEIAINPVIQTKLQDEIGRVLSSSDNKITYEAVAQMNYLDLVVHETLRKYPPAPILFRECTKEYSIPEMGVTIEKGTSVMVPLLGIQRDPEIFPEPEKFDPERFSPDEKSKRDNFSFLAFGEGPRNCIGTRFGLLQVKVGLVSVLSKYTLHVSEKTPIPIQYDKKSFILAPVGGISLRISSRESK